jgi:dihydropteroate synthase
MELVAIINLTYDSFSADGLLSSDQDFMRRRILSILNSSRIVDVGVESTRPGAVLKTAEEEWGVWQHVIPWFFETARDLGVIVSIDSRHSKIIERLIPFGIHWINDVSTQMNPELMCLAAKHQLSYVVMHQLGVPADPAVTLSQEMDVVDSVVDWFKCHIRICMEYGLKPEKIILDPGIGFGKNADQSWGLIRRSGEIRRLFIQHPLLYAHSRKSYLKDVTCEEAPERDIETLACSWYLYNQGIDYIRVHNPYFHQRFIKTMMKIENGS